MKQIWFDLDGTIANLYGVENWLQYLEAEDVTPFLVAKPLLNLSLFSRYIHKLQKAGYEIGIISWTSKCGTPSYNKAVREAKLAWLENHLPSVEFRYIHIVKYGTNKSKYIKAENDCILFDDEEPNRMKWNEKGGTAYHPNEIIRVLKALCQ